MTAEPQNKQDRSRQCEYIQSFDIFFKAWHFCPFDRKWRIQSTRYYHICDQQINFSRNRQLTNLISNIVFGGHFDFFFLKRGPLCCKKLPTDFADFKDRTAEDNFLPPLQIWRKSVKIATVRMPRRKSATLPSWRHRFRNFKI